MHILAVDFIYISIRPQKSRSHACCTMFYHTWMARVIKSCYIPSWWWFAVSTRACRMGNMFESTHEAVLLLNLKHSQSQIPFNFFLLGIQQLLHTDTYGIIYLYRLYIYNGQTKAKQWTTPLTSASVVEPLELMSWGTVPIPIKRTILRGKNWRNLQNKLVFICEVGTWTQKTPISMNTSWKQEQVGSIQNSDLCERFQLGQAQLRLPYWLPLIFIVTHASPFCPLPVPIGIICSRSATNAADTFSNKIWPAECQIWHDFKRYFCNHIRRY